MKTRLARMSIEFNTRWIDKHPALFLKKLHKWHHDVIEEGLEKVNVRTWGNGAYVTYTAVKDLNKLRKVQTNVY